MISLKKIAYTMPAGLFLLMANTAWAQGFTNPLGVTKPEDFLGNIIKFLLGLVGSLALIAIIWGGIVYITSIGDDSRIKHAKSVITWAVVGLAVVILAYTIIQTVIEALKIT